MKVAECRGCKNLLERPPYWCECLVIRQQLRNMKACPCEVCHGTGIEPDPVRVDDPTRTNGDLNGGMRHTTDWR